MQFIPVMAKLKFQHYYFSLQRHIDPLEIILLQTVVLLNIFVETVIFKKQHLIEIKIFCNTINVFTATFDKFNTPMLKKILQTPNLWIVHPNESKLKQNQTVTKEKQNGIKSLWIWIKLRWMAIGLEWLRYFWPFLIFRTEIFSHLIA